MALSKIQPASMDLTANYAFTGTNSISTIDYEEKKLATVTASSSSTLSFTSSIDNTYNIYKFKFINIHPQTDNTNLEFHPSIDNGSNYNIAKTTSFFNAEHNEDDSAANVYYLTSADLAQGTGGQKFNGDGIGADADQSISGIFRLYNPSSTTFVKHFIGNFSFSSAGNSSFNTFVAGYANTTSAINNVKFQMSSGNIDSGTIEMYGIN
tara:strand:- start:168 stop:794 length:627 start_codon:yes stop_codon:yes gene_type:complete